MRLRRLRPPDDDRFGTSAPVCAASGSGHNSARERHCQSISTTSEEAVTEILTEHISVAIRK